jgi:hypothetical protein
VVILFPYSVAMLGNNVFNDILAPEQIKKIQPYASAIV